MSKTPISSLQEIMAKGLHGLPVYDLIAEKNGTHEASFTYRVTCTLSTGVRTATGTGSNKKDAKHNAAREMLKILETNGTYVAKNVVTSNSPNVASSKPTLPVINSYYAPGSNAAPPSEIFVNSVGKLNEFCVTRKLISPQYEVRNISGPAHMMTFTITCTVGEAKTQATATTKKQAKHDAAQEMLRTLMISVPGSFSKASNVDLEREMKQDFPMIDMLNLQLEEPKIPSWRSAEMAKELFPKLRPRNSVKIVRDINVKEYHKAFGELMDPGMRENVQQVFKTITSTSRMEDELDRIAKLLETTIDTTVLMNSAHGCAVSCRLDSIPVLVDIGLGSSIVEAKKKAASNLLSTIEELFK